MCGSLNESLRGWAWYLPLCAVILPVLAVIALIVGGVGALAIWILINCPLAYIVVVALFLVIAICWECLYYYSPSPSMGEGEVNARASTLSCSPGSSPPPPWTGVRCKSDSRQIGR
jgi:hypothetical protein